MLPTLAAYVHNIDPYALQITPSFGLRWYGLSYVFGFFLGFLLILRVAKAGVSSVPPERVVDLVVTLAVGIVAGGRLGYCLFYRPELLWQFESSFPYWGLFAVNQGGMASHGGILGGIAASWWFAFRHGHRWTHILDLMAFGAPLGLFFGRIANFINGELYGRPCSPDFALAVKFPQELYEADERTLNSLQSQLSPFFPGRMSGDWIGLTIEKIQAGNQQITTIVEPLLIARHPSQLYAALSEGLVTFIVLAILYRKPVKPGTIAAGFCITYGLMRIFNEFFRMPDAHLLDSEFAAVGITRGQWLSVLLVLLGVGIIIWTRYSKLPKEGGWLSRG